MFCKKQKLSSNDCTILHFHPQWMFHICCFTSVPTFAVLVFQILAIQTFVVASRCFNSFRLFDWYLIKYYGVMYYSKGILLRISRNLSDEQKPRGIPGKESFYEKFHKWKRIWYRVSSWWCGIGHIRKSNRQSGHTRKSNRQSGHIFR